MHIKQNSNWLGQKVASMSDSDIADLIEEIAGYRETGKLDGELLHGLEKEFTDNVTHTSYYGSNMRHVEDAVLFEAARRFHNNIRS